METATGETRVANGKDYAAESSLLIDLLMKRAPHAKSLLDVACGHGGHLRYLTHHFECAGVDIDPYAVEKASINAPAATVSVADMETLDLGREFDVITCLFSSIAYVGTVERLNSSVASMTSHLSPNGVLIIEPWVMPESWLSETLKGHQAGENAITNAELAAYPPVERGLVAMRKMASASANVSGLRDAPKLAWFMRDEYEDAFRHAGLKSVFQSHGLTGRGLFVCASTWPGDPEVSRPQSVNR